MAAEVRLTITEGLPRGKAFVFRDRTVGAIGRADDCLLRLPCDLAHRDVSRHHCLLDIDPPEIRVRDLGSRNGTYVNGTKIGQRDCRLPPEVASAFGMPERPLEEGDELRVGGTVFRVSVSGYNGGAGQERQIRDDSALLIG
jgi:pSer/pThr/pTyr-binding forkhead associated (FHA) protein